MFYRKIILLTILAAVCLAMLGCSGAATNSNSAAKKDSKPAPKLSEKKPVDDLYLAKTKENTHQFEYSGYMDKTGKIVIDLRKGLKSDSDNKQYMPTGYGKNKQFLQLTSFVEGLAGFCFGDSTDIYSDSKCGFIDKTGNIVVVPGYKDMLPFSEGLAAVNSGIGLSRAWGFVDPTGNEVVKGQYENIGSFHDGLAVVENKDGKCGYIDKTGKTVVELKYTKVSDFADGLAVVQDGKNFSIIDKTGKEVKKLENATVYPAKSSYGYFLDPREKNRYGWIIAGHEDFLGPFHDGLLKIERADKSFAYVGTDGEVRFPMGAPYLEFAGQSSEGFVPVKYSNAEIESLNTKLGKDRVSEMRDCIFLDADGKSKQSFYGDLAPFSEGFAGVVKHQKDSREDRWGFINTSFETAIQPIFEKVSAFEGGLAWVRVPPDSVGFEGFKDTNWEGYIDTGGKPVIPQWQ